MSTSAQEAATGLRKSGRNPPLVVATLFVPINNSTAEISLAGATTPRRPNLTENTAQVLFIWRMQGTSAGIL
jgi:hypothetical protein